MLVLCILNLKKHFYSAIWSKSSETVNGQFSRLLCYLLFLSPTRTSTVQLFVFTYIQSAVQQMIIITTFPSLY